MSLYFSRCAIRDNLLHCSRYEFRGGWRHNGRRDVRRGFFHPRVASPPSSLRAGRWRKRKGTVQLRLEDGTTGRAEVHRYEAHGIGRVEIKIKRFLDE